MAEREKWDANASRQFWRDSMPDATPSEIAALVAGDWCLSLLAQLDSVVTASGDARKLAAAAVWIERALVTLEPDTMDQDVNVQAPSTEHARDVEQAGCESLETGGEKGGA